MRNEKPKKIDKRNKSTDQLWSNGRQTGTRLVRVGSEPKKYQQQQQQQ